MVPRIRRFVLLFLTCPLLVAEGGTFHVDRAHPQANDANPGTASLPWKTIQHAADLLNPGDRAIVHAGTYSEQVTVTRSGMPGREIVIEAAAGESVTIDGSSLLLDEWTGLLQVLDTSWVTVRGFDVVSSGPWGTNTGIQVERSSHVVVERNHTALTSSSGIQVWECADVLVADNEVEQGMTAGAASRNEHLTIGRTTRFEVRGNQVHDGGAVRGEGIVPKDGSSYGRIRHNVVHHVQGVGIYVDAWTEHTHHIEIDANRVHDVDGEGITLASEQGGLLEAIRVTNNASWHNRWLGIAVSSCCIASHPMSDLRIENNSVGGNGWSGWGGGISQGNDQASGLVLRNNAVAGNLSFEIAFEGIDPADAAIDHNLIDGWDGYPGELCGDSCRIGDPLWIDPAGGDFRISATSPAIDQGSSGGAPSDDLEGTTRPTGNGVDIGADEWAPLGSPGRLPSDLSGGEPLRLLPSPDPDFVDFSWGFGCAFVRSGYALYEGTIGSWYDHHPFDDLCTLDSLSAEWRTPSPGDRYYLVAPVNAVEEGSYGRRSDGAEIPVGTASCRPSRNAEWCP